MAKAYATRHSEKSYDAAYLQSGANDFAILCEGDVRDYGAVDVEFVADSMAVRALKYAKARSAMGLRDENGDYDV